MLYNPLLCYHGSLGDKCLQKITQGTGILTVEVSGFYYEQDVCIYPYGFDDNTEPLHIAMAVEGKHLTNLMVLPR